MAEHPARGEKTALLVIDMLNTYEHEDADRLAESVADGAARRSPALIERAREGATSPIVWVNDNYGDWNSSARGARAACAGRAASRPGRAGAPARRRRRSCSRPATASSTRRRSSTCSSSMGVGRIVLTGQVTEQCILYSALDGVRPPLRGGRAARRRRAHL